MRYEKVKLEKRENWRKREKKECKWRSKGRALLTSF